MKNNDIDTMTETEMREELKRLEEILRSGNMTGLLLRRLSALRIEIAAFDRIHRGYVL